jgi:hypothetical protein
MDIYPQYEWKAWRFQSTSPGFFQDELNHVEYFMWLAIQLNIKCPDDWYDIRQNTLFEIQGTL